MNNRWYLMSNGKVYAIWQADPQGILQLLEQKPQFQIVKPGGYATRAEAEAERQRLLQHEAK